MLPIASITTSGECTIGINTSRGSSTYYFGNNKDAFNLGMQLIKNSLLSKVILSKELKLGDSDHLLDQFKKDVVKELLDDKKFYTKLQQHEIFYSNSEEESENENNSLITDDESGDEIVALTKSMQKVIVTDDESDNEVVNK
ncbi:hypothetical protein IIV25_056R [Invertebrate iridovirus 25]|uniref:Uncharacterized protein n=1 Tax=Invertebrate iridovirus 25 TaxID=1301280 RepID=W8W2T0_9VIRU|nr:hypothetical protein IIV25_056R [Invertebrate iridovirus 25]CCV02074.1 hypothetical protein IIV25_056R [Invertebrate iridovirus 25]